MVSVETNVVLSSDYGVKEQQQREVRGVCVKQISLETSLFFPAALTMLQTSMKLDWTNFENTKL